MGTEAGVFDLRQGIRSTAPLVDGGRMPVLGLGVWRSAPGAETRRSVAGALEAGYRLIDTAAMYGNESDVGEAVRASGISRDEVFVTTKVWNDDQGFEQTLRAFARSERALGLGPVDLYLIHWPVTGQRLNTWRALEQLRREGRCRHIGVSNFTAAHLAELESVASEPPVVNQVEFHPFLFQSGLLADCRARGIQLEAYAPLVRGRRMEEPVLRAVAEATAHTPAQVLLRWGLQHGVIQIPKSVHEERIRENGSVFDFELSREQMARLDALHVGERLSWDPTKMP